MKYLKGTQRQSELIERFEEYYSLLEKDIAYAFALAGESSNA
jgi:hypothetical protein